MCLCVCECVCACVYVCMHVYQSTLYLPHLGQFLHIQPTAEPSPRWRRGEPRLRGRPRPARITPILPLRNVYLNPCLLTTDSDTECGVCMYVCVFALCIRLSHVPYGTAPTLPFILSPSLFLSMGSKDILPRAMAEDLAALAWGSGTLLVPGLWSPPPTTCAALQGKCSMYVCV